MVVPLSINCDSTCINWVLVQYMYGIQPQMLLPHFHCDIEIIGIVSIHITLTNKCMCMTTMNKDHCILYKISCGLKFLIYLATS